MTNSLSRFYDRAFPYLLLIPALAVGFTVLLYPLLNGVLLSFTRFTLLRPELSWNGLTHYKNLLADSVFREVYFNSITIVFLSVFLQFILGLTLALLLNARIPLQGVLRSTIFVIWIIPEIVTALLFVVFYNSDFGIFNFMLGRLGIISQPVNWLGRPLPAKIALILVYGWRGIPFHMVMLLAALQTVSSDLIEAATIDGAGAIRRFFSVTVPTIAHIMALCILLSIVRAFQDVTQIMILTRGGPIHSTTTLAMHVYNTAFTGFNMSRAAAIGVTWMLFLMALSVLYLRIVARGEES